MTSGEHGWRSRLKHLLPGTLAIQRLRPSERPTVLLTFDDGPHPEVTPAVLERLAAYGARAVFFVIGRRIRRAGWLLERIRLAGHVIGNHSHLHRAAYVLAELPQVSLRTYFRDCQRCQTLVERHIGERSQLFRPPGRQLTPTTLLVPKLLGLQCVLWSREINDWSFRRSDEARAGAAELSRSWRPRSGRTGRAGCRPSSRCTLTRSSWRCSTRSEWATIAP